VSNNENSLSEINIALTLLMAPIFLAPLTVIATVWDAWVLLKLWQWYIPSELASARFSIAFGFALTAHLLTFRPRRKPLTNENRYRAFGDMALQPLIILSAGWLGTFAFGHAW
jgi:hypothetical protein